MTSRFLGLRTVVYVVSDLAAARDWYAEAFGTAPYFDEPFYVGFDVGGFELGLVPEEDGDAPGPGGTHAYWGVDDADAAFDHLIGRGATPHEVPHDVGGGIRTALVRDPWGNLVGLIVNPHFGAPHSASSHADGPSGSESAESEDASGRGAGT